MKKNNYYLMNTPIVGETIFLAGIEKTVYTTNTTTSSTFIAENPVYVFLNNAGEKFFLFEKDINNVKLIDFHDYYVLIDNFGTKGCNLTHSSEKFEVAEYIDNLRDNSMYNFTFDIKEILSFLNISKRYTLCSITCKFLIILIGMLWAYTYFLEIGTSSIYALFILLGTFFAVLGSYIYPKLLLKNVKS